MFAVINYLWKTSSLQRVGHARTYSSVLLSVTIGKVKAPLAMGSGGDGDKYKGKHNDKICGHNFQGGSVEGDFD